MRNLWDLWLRRLCTSFNHASGLALRTRRRPSGAHFRRRWNASQVELLESRVLLSATVLSIDTVPPHTYSTNTASLDYLVTFSENVTGVAPADFRVVTTGSLSAAGPVVVTPNSALVYTVTVNGVHGTGTLRLDLIDDD